MQTNVIYLEVFVPFTAADKPHSAPLCQYRHVCHESHKHGVVITRPQVLSSLRDRDGRYPDMADVLLVLITLASFYL
jgi:hypothetical protein